MRKAFIVLWLLLVPIATASAQVSIGIGLPGISIGINLPVYPQLVPVGSTPNKPTSARACRPGLGGIEQPRSES